MRRLWFKCWSNSLATKHPLARDCLAPWHSSGLMNRKLNLWLESLLFHSLWVFCFSPKMKWPHSKNKTFLAASLGRGLCPNGYEKDSFKEVRAGVQLLKLSWISSLEIPVLFLSFCCSRCEDLLQRSCCSVEHAGLLNRHRKVSLEGDSDSCSVDT